MRRFFIISTLLLLAGGTKCMGGAPVAQQPVKLRFEVADCTDSVLYIARHYRDELLLLDSMRVKHVGGITAYILDGRRDWARGIYALVRQDCKTVLTDFLLDDSRTFTLSGDSKMSAASIKVKGSKANQLMYTYRATEDAAHREADSLRKAGDEEGVAALSKRMIAYEEQMDREGMGNLYLQLERQCEPPEVPDAVEDKPYYYRIHYWDSVTMPINEELKYCPQLFNKMNYFFFGLLYRANADTIIKDLDRLMGLIGDDTAMSRYVLQFIEPRYYRSTRNVGWDAVWCHIAQEYILKGRCPWMRESEVYLAKQNYERISKSIIGSHGQELWMLDTTQIDAPEHWFSSHRQPTRYVILWFWDPDCHHCQEQSAELKVLYDSLQTAPDRRFEVYAVGYDSDVEKWKRYVKEHEFRWINVGGTHVNIDYQEAYNVHGAPTMIILNENRDIIMNKVLPIKGLLQFLDNYEKQQPKKQ